MSDLNFLPAGEIARMIQEGTVSSSEILETCLTQISKHNDKLNAICTLDEERARQKAKEADEAIAIGENWGPLHGVPITIKDIFETSGLPTTAGYKPLKNYIPERDATAVARLRGAGAIIFAKTNPAELAGDYQSTNDIFGRANNPWNLHCTAGGSSGGSAAAVAAGFSPLDLGDDIAGSIRQPAHFCGIFGLKPTDRRVSTAGHIPEVPGMPKCIRQMLTVGPLARCIEDLQLSFSLIAGADPRQPEIPQRYFEALTDRDRLTVRMDLDLEPWDAWLCPVAVTTAFTHRSKGAAIEVDGRKIPYTLANGAYTAPLSLTGHPVVAIPIGQTKAGLPVGMQIVGKRWKEMELLAIAQQISEIVGNFQRPSMQ